MSTWNRVSPVNASDNGDGGRVKKTATSDGNTTTTYIGKLYVCEGGGCAKLLYAGGQRIAIKQVSSGSISYFHPDHLGSTSVLTNGSGTKEEDLVYYPYGETFTNTGTANVAYKYTGKELDDSTGLYFYEARYYDAVLGRFISADTLVPNPANPQAFNRYTYGNNNPILYNDPTGHFGFKSIKKGFKKVSNFLKDKLGPVGFVLAAVTIQTWEPFTGTALLTQSKGGRYVLAGEIIVASAVATWYCGGCGAGVGALVGSTTTGAFGGYSAAQNGGDISKGVLFGTATGAITGALNGWATGTFNFSGSPTFWQGVGIFGARIGAGVVAGAAGGSTVGYAGGAGGTDEILHGAFHGAIVGAAITGAFTTVDALGGIALKYGGTPPTSQGGQLVAASNYDFGPMITILDAKATQALTRSPLFSSLAVSGASGYDVLSNGQLSKKAGEKGGNINCSIEFGGDSGCGFGKR